MHLKSSFKRRVEEKKFQIGKIVEENLPKDIYL